MASQRLSGQQSTTGLKVALRIIHAWQATPAQACRILRISPSTFRRASKGASAGSRLDLDQHQRIGMVLGIHASLRTVFDNPANAQGFPGFSNDNSFFEGRSPIEIMATGDMISFYEAYKRITQLQFGQR
ncbi:antitoxin Xre-like helix-turn-helix domain-containing protein [Pseudomonas syringae]|uniref:antitoxin Xre-like helix-turn-helix domain-containing protein n=1 Tax=Pseudomonas syringae TaxID=317 RepID=UPI0011D059D8|nr:antitoxin Xre-like helix-turn-helix domain-containing protein [Pseudomonas syringae]